MAQYHDTNGRLPPAAVCGKDGKPLYSWRVLVLPYLGEQDLYNEFKLDEAWDSPHNIKLLPRMPLTYTSRRKAAPEPYCTYYQVFVGKGTAFEDPQGEKFDSFTDGTSNTFLIVEAGEPVPWTKPEDLPYAPDKPLPKLGGIFKDGFRAVFADGHMRFIRRDTSEETIRAMITRNGGEKIEYP